MSESASVADPDEITENWNGVVRKIWVDEMPDDEAFESTDTPHYTDAYTETERRQLETHGKSALKVNDSEYETVLRVIFVRSELVESVEDEIQVFVAVSEDDREKDRLHLARGVSLDDVLEREENSDRVSKPITRVRERSGTELIHIGSFAEYRETADEYEFDFTGGTSVPTELIEAVSPHTLGKLKERASA